MKESPGLEVERMSTPKRPKLVTATSSSLSIDLTDGAPTPFTPPQRYNQDMGFPESELQIEESLNFRIEEVGDDYDEYLRASSGELGALLFEQKSDGSSFYRVDFSSATEKSSEMLFKRWGTEDLPPVADVTLFFSKVV